MTCVLYYQAHIAWYWKQPLGGARYFLTPTSDK